MSETLATATHAGLRGLGARLDGEVLAPGDGGYDAARTVWNAMVDRRPAAIVRCRSVGDVVAAVRAARDAGLEVGVRCGGHSVVGHAVPDGGMMIDLTPMGAVRVDPERRRAWVQGGALLGALDEASQAHGLATTAGNVSHTGVGGLTLGGGMGWLGRQLGLTCDNVVSFQLVAADGRVVRASAEEEPELFWGLRGGGGNFGIVTEFEFRLHPVGTRTLVAELSYPVEAAADVLAGWRDLAPDAPRPAAYTFGVDGRTATSGVVWVGDPDEGRRLLPGLRALGRPVAERVSEPSYLELQRRDDTPQGHAARRYWKGHYLRSMPDDAVEAIVLRGTPDGVGRPGDLLPRVSVINFGGAIADVPDGATAFSHRDAAFEYTTSVGWADPAEDAARMAGARRAAGAVERHASGVYVNALSDEGAGGLRRAYSDEKMTRLTALKDAFDPDNVFHLNANIRPSG